MTTQLKRLWIIVLPVSLLLGAGSWFVWRDFGGLPSNADVLDHWKRNGAEIIDLRNWLIQQPAGIEGIGSQGVIFQKIWKQVHPEEAGMSLDVYGDVRKRMANAGILSMQRNELDESFLFAARGYAGKGYRLAFVHRDSMPLQLLKTLDDFRRVSGDSSVAYVRLEENWYARLVW